MERFFPADKIIMTGNPVRQNVLETTITPEEARKQFGLDPEKKTILLVGGSLGARTINESVLQHLDLVKESGVQFIWQTGKYYNAAIMEQLKGQELPMLKVTDFISDMGQLTRQPTWLSAAQVPAVSASSASSANRLSWFQALMWLKTTRPRTPWH